MLDCVVIEVRQHLCCANVFLRFKKSLTDSDSLKINVDEHKVELQNRNCHAEILVNNYFSILAGTFSNLIVDVENASFRISIKEIQIPNDLDDSREYIKIQLREHDEASILCRNCESILCAPQKYQKIREFPSGSIDVSEFFCHHGPSFKDVLVPAVQDLFYGFQFIVINNGNIVKDIRIKEGHIYCKRCLKYLGETMFNEKAVKLWSDTIKLELNEQHMDIFDSNNKTLIHQLMLKAINETSLPSPEPLLQHMHFTKVLLEAVFPNRQHQHLLVHILEKHLPVLRNREEDFETDIFVNSGNGAQQNIQLKLKKAFKILYRLISQDTEDKEDETTNSSPLLEYWQQDINILKMKISPFLFKALNDELNANILLLPEVYRNNNDDFLLSYIFY